MGNKIKSKKKKQKFSPTECAERAQAKAEKQAFIDTANELITRLSRRGISHSFLAELNERVMSAIGKKKFGAKTVIAILTPLERSGFLEIYKDDAAAAGKAAEALLRPVVMAFQHVNPGDAVTQSHGARGKNTLAIKLGNCIREYNKRVMQITVTAQRDLARRKRQSAAANP